MAAHTRPSRLPTATQPSRPLSSSDEVGPVTKKLRRPIAGTRRAGEAASKALKQQSILAGVAEDARLKKARARPALTVSNSYSSLAGRRPQSAAASSRNTTVAGAGKSERDTNAALTRRSARLMGGNSKATTSTKVREHIMSIFVYPFGTQLD